MKRPFLLTAAVGLSVWSLVGCGGRSQPVATMAPPVSNPAMAAPPMNTGMNGAGMNGGGMGAAPQGGGGVFNWQDVPANQQVPIMRAMFDQGGYQLVADNGDTIVVPFVNNNLYVMRFGRSNGQTYFVNEAGAPTLYLAQGFGLANAAAQGALWYPLPSNFDYQRPVYVGIAPSWSDYLGMGWYPGMAVYGGMYGYHPYGYTWMPHFYINIGGSPYYGWGGYHSYYVGHPGYYHTVYGSNRSYYNTVTRGTGSYRYTGTGSYRPGGGGSFRPSGTGSYRPSGTGSFRPGGGFNTGGGIGGTRPSGSFRPSSPSSFPTGGSFNNGTRPSGSFNSGGGSTMPAPRGSFSGGSSGFNSTPRPSGGSSFSGGGSSRPSGSFNSGGSSRPSGSFGGGGRSSGGFGGGRRR